MLPHGVLVSNINLGNNQSPQSSFTPFHQMAWEDRQLKSRCFSTGENAKELCFMPSSVRSGHAALCERFLSPRYCVPVRHVSQITSDHFSKHHRQARFTPRNLQAALQKVLPSAKIQYFSEEDEIRIHIFRSRLDSKRNSILA